MPNWCENKLIVKSNGYESEFLKFMEQGRNTEIIKGKKVKVWRISNYIPTPERLLEENLSENEKKELINIYGFDNWSDWRCSNWGTHWDCDDIGFEWSTDEKSFYILDFESAWSPPIQFLIRVSILFPSLSFQLEYIEPGCLFAGVNYINNGLLLEIQSNPVYKNENGEIIDITFDDENKQYVLSDGEIYDEDDWFNQEISIERNPFENFKY
jgi:hypothetical protein